MKEKNLLQKALLKLQGKIETIEEIKKAKGEKFNIFSILNMERLEVKTHSAFIYELLNPKASHSQGLTYLKLFFETVLVDCNNFNFDTVFVQREHYISNEGRIDFTIYNQEIFIAIEMKIDAPDQPKQIQRYIDIAKKKALNHKVYYLTLDGKDASDKSIKNIDTSHKPYLNISFSNDIIKWLEKCIEKSASLPNIRESLIQYLNLIYKLTGKTTKGTIMEIEKMIDSPSIIQAATEMSKNLGFVWAKKEALFWSKLIDAIESKNELSEWNLNLFCDENDKSKSSLEDIAKSINELRSSKNVDVRICFTKIINNKEITLRLYEYNSQDYLAYQLDEIEDFDKDNMIELAKKLNLERKNGEDRWDSSDFSINFYGKNVSEPTYALFDNAILKNLIGKVADDVYKKLKIIDIYF